MSMTVLDHADPRPSTTPSERLQLTTAAVRVSFTWLGVRKTLTPEQKSRAAESFGAEKDYLSARKKLLDTNHPAYKEVSAIRNRATAYWRGMTLPYPEPGVRLIRQDQIAAFNQRMNDLQKQLQDAVARLEESYVELKESAQRRLGDLFNPADYPPSLRGLFDLAWDFPSVQPPDYLLQLHPAIYEQQKNRIAARFEEAVQLAEQAFTTEFARLVSHLTERLSSPDGERKTFRNSAVANLTNFFERFKELNVHSSEQLDALVQQAQNIVQGVRPQELRNDSFLRQHIATELAGVQAALDGLLVDRPRRRIVRNQ